MRILILGAGGIGGYFGGRLTETGGDVTFLVRPKRAEALASGLQIRGPSGDASVKVKTATKVDAPFDLVILSCKAYGLADAIEAIRPAVGPETVILPLLNGIAHLDALDSAFDADQVLGGLAHISVTLAEDGTVRQLNKLQTLTFGARSPSQTDRCASVAKAFANASFDVRQSDKIMQEMWEKFTFITAAAAIACLMRASTRDIMSADDGELLTCQMLEECYDVAAGADHPVRDKAREWATKFLTDRTSDFKPSMLHDVERGGRIEADHLVGDMIRRGEAQTIETVLLKIAFCQLQAYEAGRAKQASAS